MHRLKLSLLAIVALAAAIAVFSRGPIPQDPAFHCFADQRAWLGIPNFADVISNLPFLLVGLLGIAALLTPRRTVGVLPQLRTAYLLFFGGVALVAIGSGYYHWHPTSATLVWDRLPITIAFMAFFTIVLEETLGKGARWLWPLVAVGIASVLYWAATDDLRPYVLVQFLPILLIPLILLLFRSTQGHAPYFWAVLGLYLVSKALEWADHAVFQHGALLSGHTLKHLFAAAATGCVLLAIRQRKRPA